MIYEIDPETGVVKDMLEPIDGDMMFGMTYSETTDLFTSIMNFYLYVDQPFTHEAEQEIIDSYDQEEHMFMWHRLDMSSYLKASDQNFQTGETGNGSIVDVVFCGITTWRARASSTSARITWASTLRKSATSPPPPWFSWTMWAACGTSMR